jgi:uncharacterized protein
MSDPSTLGDDYDDPLERSPLERDITRDGVTVRLFIYRGREDDAGWILEIEDEEGGSTVWDDLFDSDQAALAEALRTIDEDGIRSFADQPRDGAGDRAVWELAMAQPTIAELRRALDASEEAMSFHGACGVFAAVASAPELLRPGAWLDMIRGDHVFADLAGAQRFTGRVMALYSEVLRSVGQRGADCCPPAEDHEAVREFCAGYVRIAFNDPIWAEDAHALAELLPMCALAGAVPLEKVGELEPAFTSDPEGWLGRRREELADTVSSLHAYWDEARKAAAERLRQHAVSQRRPGPKIGRNDPCTCGSGKKFKKCCAH